MSCRKFAQNIPVRISQLRPFSSTSTMWSSKSSDRSDISTETHTGQVFDDKDYRNLRFTHSRRIVNPNWGIKLIAEVPPKECTERVVSCNGGDGPLGHPKIYINLDKPGDHSCGYCGLRFVKKEGHHH